MRAMPAAPFPVEDLFDRLPDVVFFAKDREGRYVRANETLVARCGKRHKREILGRTAEELFPRALGAAYTAQDREVLRTGAPIEDKLELHLYPGGRYGWCLTFKVPLRGPSGTTTGLVGISRDLHRPDERHPEYARLARAVEAIHARFGETVRLAALASRVGLSMDRFERLVKQVFHVTPRQLLVKTRVDAASRLLRETEATVAAIAQACGYADHSAFTRQFRATVGLTPRAFREQGVDDGRPVLL
jgi:AraC-like DNA-binding protein